MLLTGGRGKLFVSSKPFLKNDISKKEDNARLSAGEMQILLSIFIYVNFIKCPQCLEEWDPLLPDHELLD